MIFLKIKIYGKAQGVFFRHSAKKKAEELEISGLARNEEDGTVYIEAQGEKENLEKFIKWCRVGPAPASVEKVEFEYSKETKNFDKIGVYGRYNFGSDRAGGII